MLRPQLRIPIWFAVVVVLAAWASRGVMRGGDFSVSAGDFVVLGIMVAALFIVGMMRANEARHQQEQQSSNKDQRERGATGQRW